jgi:exopolysaccharide production protein ExoQ
LDSKDRIGDHPLNSLSARQFCKGVYAMPPNLALLLWAVLLLGLLRFDPAKDPGTSAALWLPVFWMFFVGSRLPSQWLGVQVAVGAQALEEGNALDRTIFFGLIAWAIAILMARGFNWGAFFSRNIALCLFIGFALVSVVWSDYSFVAFKRWFRDLGFYVMPLLVLSDPRPAEALRTVLRRLCYLLIPLSVLLVKYFPNIGAGYDYWTGIAQYNGATTSKNQLGVACLISTVFFLWDTLTRWSDRKDRRTRRILIVNFAMIGMSLWLLSMAHSATSTVCLSLGCLIVFVAHGKSAQRRPGLLKFLIPTAFILYLILAFGFDINGQLAGAVGRDPTLTDRTLIWKLVLGMHTNPLVGIGYESFWLGSRMSQIAQKFENALNEAHNGYLEIYLDLGMIGIALLVGFLLSSYRKVCKQFSLNTSAGSLPLAVWLVVLFYNMTESSFKWSLLWTCFLLLVIAIPEPAENPVREAADFKVPKARTRKPRIPLETGVRTR